MSEFRTHSAASAVDDEPAAAAPTPIPGIEALPSDLGDSPHGDMPLEYTLQNFNALVAANTALQTEASSAALRIAELELHIADLRGVHEVTDRVARDGRNDIAALKKERDDAREDHAFLLAERTELQRKLDRALGYVDRFLDEEADIRGSETRTVPAPKPDVGPGLESIPRAHRRSDRVDMMAYGEAIQMSGDQRRRRY